MTSVTHCASLFSKHRELGSNIYIPVCVVFYDQSGRPILIDHSIIISQRIFNLQQLCMWATFVTTHYQKSASSLYFRYQRWKTISREDACEIGIGVCLGYVLRMKATLALGKGTTEKLTAFICDLQHPSSPRVKLTPSPFFLVFQCCYRISKNLIGLDIAIRTAGHAFGDISEPWTPLIHSSSTSVCKAPSVSRSRRSGLDGRLIARILSN